MPSLNWIGKDAVVKHHKDVPFRLLEPVPSLSCEGGAENAADTGNLIVQGDNLLALKALLPRYAGQVKCIYIDPPYNTGNEGWAYNDNVNSPEIKRWLGEVVGKEGETLDRHDRWLCMMYPRLMLLKQFLRKDGVIFVSIDDNELANLLFLCDEIFGAGNRVGSIVWKNVTDNNPTQIASEHEYVICYAREKTKLKKEWKSTSLAVKTKLLEIGQEFISKFSDQDEMQSAYTQWFRKYKDQLWPFDRYKFIDAGGVYTGSQSVHNPGKEGYRYDVVHPVTRRSCQQPLMGYRFPEETMKRLLDEKRILFGEDETKLIELKVYAKDYRAKLSSLFELDGRIGTNEVKSIFPENKRPFDFPKPVELIEELLSFTTDQDDLVLDSFGGSGTTGQAVLSLNRADGKSRRFILVEMDEGIAQNVTSERVRRVANGYINPKGEAVPGLGGGFQFCKLGKPLFDARGHISPDVRFAELARFVWFTETGMGMPAHLASKNAADTSSPLLGVHQGRAVYLLYNGILKDRSIDGGNVLTSMLLDQLPAHDGPRVIYGARCAMGADRLRKLGIVFKQLPYHLRVAP